MKSLRQTSFLITTFCFTLVTLSFFVSMNLDRVLTKWGQEIEMTVFLKNISIEDQQTLISQLQKMNYVKSVQLISQQEAINQLQTQSSQISSDLLQNPKLLSFIPASLNVQFQSIDPQMQKMILEQTAQKIQNLNGVDEVNYGQDWIENYAQFVHVIQIVTLAVSIIILLASLFVIGNVIYTTIDARKDEIAVLELIGASFSMIRKPFLLQGLTLGFAAGLISLLITWVLYSSASYQLKNIYGFKMVASYLHYFSISQFSILCLFYAGIGLVSSYFCVRWMNNGRISQRQAVD